MKQKIHKKLKRLNDRVDRIEQKRKFEKSLAITLIGFFGAIFTIYIDKIKQGTMNLPSEWGFLQITGIIVFLLIFFWGAILLSKKK